MGYCPRALAIIGVRIDKAILFRQKRVKNSDDNHPDDWLYDPKTGRCLWYSEDICILGDQWGDDCDAIDGLQLVISDDKKDCLIGIVARAEADLPGYRSITKDTIEDVKNKLERLLQPHDLWRVASDTFGLWALETTH